ncbi:polysaccharide deacetylase family protein [Parvularcula marina]|uniref:Chitooligosaccharide deacetylase n=1 Tax=Parvularcula marina TaxID=2292771 RepID=A0A371RH93_9PROT|nr:polysaccharide deacetylase family protein [Parvularcula marina]RFB04820.1 polysaccharide deacetylase [Parvularcula marina]
MKTFLSLLTALIAAFSLAAAEPAPRRIALTYDDGPREDGRVFTGDERATALIAALKGVEAGPVAFFVTTDGFDQLPGGKARMERYAAAGHLIGNHSHTHQWAHRVSAEDYLADIDEAIVRLEGFENWRPWYRYPYLDEGREIEKRDVIAAGLAERGLSNGYVTIDNYDWYIDSQMQKALKEGREVDFEKLGQLYTDMLLGAADFFDEAAVDTLGRSPIHVLLLHENDIAALYADDLVTALREAGWEIVSPDEAFADSIAQMIPETLFTGQGRVAALAADNGRSPRTFDYWASDEARIDSEIEARGIFGEVTDE